MSGFGNFAKPTPTAAGPPTGTFSIAVVRLLADFSGLNRHMHSRMYVGVKRVPCNEASLPDVSGFVAIVFGCQFVVFGPRLVSRGAFPLP